MIVAGIDTGGSGAAVALDTNSNRAWRQKLAYSKDQKVLLFDLFEYIPPDVVVIEKIHGRGGWHANTNFQMGNFFGQMLQILHRENFTYEIVYPEIWTKSFHPKHPVKGTKAKSLAAYLDFYPHDPIGPNRGRGGEKGWHDGTVDALLIATHYCMLEGINIRKWKFQD